MSKPLTFINCNEILFIQIANNNKSIQNNNYSTSLFEQKKRKQKNTLGHFISSVNEIHMKKGLRFHLSSFQPTFSFILINNSTFDEIMKHMEKISFCGSNSLKNSFPFHN